MDEPDLYSFVLEYVNTVSENSTSLGLFFVVEIECNITNYPHDSPSKGNSTPGHVAVLVKVVVDEPDHRHD